MDFLFKINGLDKLVNLGLRGLSLLSKLFLVIYITKLFVPADVGQYILFSSFIIYLVGFIGFEFHTYSSRQLIRGNDKDYVVISNLLLFYVSSFVVCVPLSIAAYYFSGLSLKYIFIFLIVLLLEGATLEIFRILVVMLKNISASLLLFFKTALWIVFFSGLTYINDDFAYFEYLLYLWVLGLLLSLIYGLFSLSKLFDFSKVNILKYGKYSWIKTGMKTSIFMFISAQAVLVVFVLDKWMVSNFDSIELLAVYGLFFGISSGIYSFLEASVIVYFYPKLMRSFPGEEFNGLKTSFLKQVFYVGSLLVVFSSVIIFLVLDWIDKEHYRGLLPVFFILAFANFFKSMAAVYHYVLYSASLDGKNVISNVLSMCVFIFYCLISLSLGVSAIYSASLGVLTFFISQLVFKFSFWKVSGCLSEKSV